MKLVKVGVIGCGVISNVYFKVNEVYDIFEV